MEGGSEEWLKCSEGKEGWGSDRLIWAKLHVGMSAQTALVSCCTTGLERLCGRRGSMAFITVVLSETAYPYCYLEIGSIHIVGHSVPERNRNYEKHVMLVILRKI